MKTVSNKSNLPKESVAMVSLIFIFFGSDIMFTQRVMDRYYGLIEGAQAFGLGAMMVVFGLCGVFAYCRCFRFSVKVSVGCLCAVAFVALGVACVWSLFEPAVYVSVLKILLPLICLVVMHIMHRYLLNHPARSAAL